MSTRRCGSSSTAGHRPGLIPILALLAAIAAGCSDVAAPGDAGSTTSATIAAPSPPASKTADGAEAAVDELADTDGGAAAEAPRFEPAAAVWTGCGGGYQCATVTVPLDHGRPDGATIDLALVRVPATDADGSGILGSILVNPGGPGGSGVDYVRGGFRLDENTMDDYHLVGFDPRGVGASSPLRCRVEPGAGLRPDLSPDDEAEAAALDEAARSLAARCRRLDGDVLPHLSTDSVVEDLELLRRAVGDDRLHFLGQSYGTVIGLRYAARYGDRVGHLVLDGVVDPTMTLPELLAQQAEEFDRVFDTLDRSCGTALACPEDGVAAARDRLMARLERGGPIDGVGPAELDIATLLSLYGEELWPALAEALIEAEAGSSDRLRRLNDLYARAADPAAYAAVVCTDTPVPAGPEAWDALAGSLAQRSARFGSALANEVRACAHWPVRASAVPEPVVAEEAGPILVLSTTGDAATPLANAVEVAATLDEAGLVTVDDDGHTAYGRSFCVTRIVADYFATGEIPATVHRC